jgi:hypothetical protein
MEQRPSIGRIVVYNHPGSADGKFGRVQSPAIIQKVNEDGSCQLFVMSTSKGLWFSDNISQGDGPSQWNWPTRI